jgi:4-phospho-D-threonate 3-dehydrogenase / 4-phospho-D-erythronate 3-dehydrogenase
LSKIVGVVIGDPGGVGPEVCVKALATGEPQSNAEIVLIGSLDAVRLAAGFSNVALTFERATFPLRGTSRNGVIPVVDPGNLKAGDITIGTPSKAAGEATAGWVKDGVRYAEEGAIDGLIVAPVDMTSFHLAGIDMDPYFEPDHILLLRQTGQLRTVPIAEHVLMRNVPPMVKKERVLSVIRTVDSSFKSWGTASARIAVAGLNPHCIGEEDEDEIKPAVAAAREAGIDASGPYSPDTIFRRGVNGDFDVIVTMYHDQGQIAVKTIGLDHACGIFIGLPYVRVGIPHGSAMEIAGKNAAFSGTALVAMNTAARLVNGGGI